MTAPGAAAALWITWESQPRNRSMARELGIQLHEVHFTGRRLWRYLRSAGTTVRILFRERPAVVFASNPSLVLTYVLLACRLLFRFRFATDAHYGGIVAVRGGGLLQRLLNFANARADLVVVTNPKHADRVERVRGRPFVCPDPLPQLSESLPKPPGLAKAEKSALFICTYEVDEPYLEMFEAARLLAGYGFTIFASGSYARAGLSPQSVPHVVLLGYVDRPSYEAYLLHVDLVVDLTNWADCLVCGAYEAIAARKPCVLSRTPALTALFTHGTVFASHQPGDIARAVLAAYERREELRSQIDSWIVPYEASTRTRIAALRSALGLARVV